MRQTLPGITCTIVLACAQPALAGDFRPLTSQELTGGVYEFDHILIPEGVTLTLVREPGQVTLWSLGDLTLANSLVAPGWEVTLQAGGSLQLLGSSDVTVSGLNLFGQEVLFGQGVRVATPDGNLVTPGLRNDIPRGDVLATCTTGSCEGGI